MLSEQEQKRYQRQIKLPDLGEGGQASLRNAAVLVIGAGGLGCPVLTYLNAAGVGRLGIVDNDVVHISNLHRQVLFTEDDIGLLKAEVASIKLRRQNPHTTIDVYPEKINRENALDIMKTYDIVVDGSDNFPTRYLLNDASYLLKKPLVYGAIHQFEGQVSVFNQINDDGEMGPNYRDLFPTPPLPGQVLNCAQVGVLGVLPGIIGSLQANEVIKIILGQETLSGMLNIFDARTSNMMQIKIKKLESNPISGTDPSIRDLIDYDAFCHIDSSINKISHHRLIELISGEDDITIVDVREPHEIKLNKSNEINIPMSALSQSLDRIPTKGKVVFKCQSGQRSVEAVKILREKGINGEFYSLEGGAVD